MTWTLDEQNLKGKMKYEFEGSDSLKAAIKDATSTADLSSNTASSVRVAPTAATSTVPVSVSPV